jgi:hypothetical protein
MARILKTGIESHFEDEAFAFVFLAVERHGRAMPLCSIPRWQPCER